MRVLWTIVYVALCATWVAFVTRDRSATSPTMMIQVGESQKWNIVNDASELPRQECDMDKHLDEFEQARQKALWEMEKAQQINAQIQCELDEIEALNIRSQELTKQFVKINDETLKKSEASYTIIDTLDLQYTYVSV